MSASVHKQRLKRSSTDIEGLYRDGMGAQLRGDSFNPQQKKGGSKDSISCLGPASYGRSVAGTLHCNKRDPILTYFALPRSIGFKCCINQR